MGDFEGLPGLILTRKPGERILIGDDIAVEVAEIVSATKVRIRVSAPRDVAIDREELRERKEREAKR